MSSKPYLIRGLVIAMMLAILIGVALISVNSNSQVNEYVTVKVRVGNIMN